MNHQNTNKQQYSKTSKGKNIMSFTVDGVQPNNIEAEEAVLGAILTGGTNTYELANGWIKEYKSFFIMVIIKEYGKAMTNLYYEHEKIDMVTVSNEN